MISLRQPHRGVAFITGKRFVAAVAVQSDRHMLARFARNVVSRNRGRICVRLAVMLNQDRQNFERIRTDDELVMVRADVFRDPARVMQFAEVLFFKADRKRLYRRRSTPRSSTPRPRSNRSRRKETRPAALPTSSAPSPRRARISIAALAGFLFADIELSSRSQAASSARSLFRLCASAGCVPAPAF